MHRLGHPSLRPLGFAGQPGLGGLDVGIYHRIMATRPQNLIKFHPLWESSGAVALDYSWRHNNGTHVGVTLGEPGPGDGRFSPFYDGLLDYSNISGAGFAGDFNGDELTYGICVAPANVAVWTDAAIRNLTRFSVDANNYYEIRKDSANNTLNFNGRAGGGFRSFNVAGLSFIDWHFVMYVTSTAGNFTRGYIDGIQVGSTVAAAAWAGPINAAFIGSLTAVPARPWHGGLAFFPCWNVALTPAEVFFVSRRM